MNTPEPGMFPRRPPRCRALDGDDARLVAHGTIVDRYGFDTLVAAMPRILSSLPGCRLTIIGDGPDRPRITELVRSLHMTGSVTLTGHVPLPEMASRLVDFDIGIVANRKDEFTDVVIPTKLMEYAALGVPVVAARTTAIEASVGDAVRMFEPGDAESLAAAVIGFVRDTEARQAKALRAQEIVCEIWGWQRSAATYGGLVEALAGVS
jgi:glycosyltransferase involved in cell wall biosynthesis